MTKYTIRIDYDQAVYDSGLVGSLVSIGSGTVLGIADQTGHDLSTTLDALLVFTGPVCGGLVGALTSRPSTGEDRARMATMGVAAEGIGVIAGYAIGRVGAFAYQLFSR